MKAKITKLEFKKIWGEGYNKVFFHDIWLEGQGDKPWNIGAKKESPDFLSEGKTLEYEIVDESKRKIKKFSPKDANKTAASTPAAKPQTSTPSTPPVESTSLIRNLDNYNESDLIFIDIETVRAVKKLEPGTPIHDAWLYKTRYNNELERKSGEPVTPEEYFDEKASLYAVFAKVVAIVAGRIVPDNLLSVKRYNVKKETKWDEKVMLEEFNNDMINILKKNGNTSFAGYANFGFDQPFLNKRMIINGIKPNILLDTNHLKPWEMTGIDLKNQWQGGSFYPDSLISVAVALGLPSPKSNMEGSQVGEYYYAGKINEIVEYCVGDVLTEANVYRKFVGRPLLTLK
jgi:hypothetical protein